MQKRNTPGFSGREKRGIISLTRYSSFMRSASPLAPAELRGNRLWMRNYTISLRSWYNIAKQKWIPQIMRMILRWNDMDIKKVAVLGAGAVGSYVIWGLSARRDIELGVVADGPRGERLRKDKPRALRLYACRILPLAVRLRGFRHARKLPVSYA